MNEKVTPEQLDLFLKKRDKERHEPVAVDTMINKNGQCGMFQTELDELIGLRNMDIPK